MAFYLGLDLGGTNIKAGVVDDTGKLLSRVSVPTQAAGGPDVVIANMVRAGEKAAGEAMLDLKEIDAIGVGTPGPMDPVEGVVFATPNLPGWKHVPLRARISEATGRPSIIENDANAAAFGEFWVGAGRDPAIRHLTMLTLGTGIGTGVIYDGKLIHGAFFVGGEGGHIIVQPGGRLCGCGQHGCLETYASASNTAARARESLEAGAMSSLTDAWRADPRSVTAKSIFEAAQRGDEFAIGIVKDTARYLGIACVNFCRLLDPQMIVFAGGMVLAGDYLIDLVRSSFAEQTWKINKEKVQIAVARLGNDAGIIGAAGVAWDAHRTGKLR